MMITRSYLPNNPNVDALRDYIKNATDEYYKRNTVYGCMDPKDSNFNYQANVDDGTCVVPSNNYTFGGIYQVCSPVSVANGYAAPDSVCDKFRQINDITGDYSCPDDYDAVLLYSDSNQLDCHQDTNCHKCWLFFTCCHTQTDCDKLNIQSYWCRAKPNVEIPPNTGEMFGGLFIDGGMNPFTGTTGCPGSYKPYRLGLDLNICMSRDYQLDVRYSKKFQGFFTCQTQQGCSDGYSQHFASTIYGCDIFYCVRPEAFQDYTPRPIIRPPFLPISSLINETQSSLAIYLNGTLSTKLSLKQVLQEMYTLNVNNLVNKTNTDIIPFSIKDAISQWTESYIETYSKNISGMAPTESIPNPTSSI